MGDEARPRALLDGLRYDRQATRYRPAISWVERILNLLSPDLRSGAKPAPGLLFDMNLLFERVVEQRMARWASERGWAMETQDTSRYLTEIISEPKRCAYQVRPDLVFRHKREVVAIADAKWKRPEVSSRGFVLPAQPDLYQLHAYAAVFQCSQLALIYPWSERFITNQPTVFEIPPGADKSVQIAIHSLDVGSDEFPILPTLSFGRQNPSFPDVCHS